MRGQARLVSLDILDVYLSSVLGRPDSAWSVSALIERAHSGAFERVGSLLEQLAPTDDETEPNIGVARVYTVRVSADRGLVCYICCAVPWAALLGFSIAGELSGRERWDFDRVVTMGDALESDIPVVTTMLSCGFRLAEEEELGASSPYALGGANLRYWNLLFEDLDADLPWQPEP